MAPWRATLRSHKQYLASLATRGLPTHAVFLIETVRLEGAMSEVMHTLGQGVTSHVVGNVMFEVIVFDTGVRHTRSRQRASMPI